LAYREDAPCKPITSACRFCEGAAETVVTGPAHPFFQEVNFHRQLADLALQLGDLALMLSNTYFVEFVCKLSRLALLDPLDEAA